MRFIERRNIEIVTSCLPLLAVLLDISEAFARAGGGHSYSGRSSGSGYSGGHSHSGGGGGDLIGMLFWLLFRHPAVGITLLLIVGICYFVFFRYSALPAGFSTTADSSLQADDQLSGALRGMIRLPAAPLMEKDPKFSLPLFLDFASALAHRSLTAYNTPAMSNLEPYISTGAFAQLLSGAVLKNVVVGSVEILRAETRSDMDRLTVAISFCATVNEDGRDESLWFESEWTFSRQAGVTSKGPQEILRLACPSCGASSEKDAAGACAYCGEKPAPGSEAWTVSLITIGNRESRAPVDLGSYADEKGTYLPTVYSPLLSTGLKAIMNCDNRFTREQADQRFRQIFMELQNAWSNRDLPAIRPLVSDQLFRVYIYWIEAYRSAGIRNVISTVSIRSVEIVAAEVDPFYDSITARIAASMVDQCIDESGQVVGGDSTPRSFSEYWTFVRICGGKETAALTQNCSGCGAALEVGMTGECRYCGMLVSGSNFDWILSRIAQDEDYGT